MLMQQQRQPEYRSASVAQSFGALYNLSYALTLVVAPLIRRGFGSRAFDPHIVLTVAVLLVLSCVDPVLTVYTGVWFLAVVYHRLKALGLPGHSRYPGRSWVAMCLPFVKTAEQGYQAEVLVCLALTVLADGVSWYLTALLLATTVGLVVKQILDVIIDRARVRAMRDQRIELDYYAERFRREV